ncbi:MAG TPA: hypothetical protein VJ976_03565 [Ornithinimicrobium sp.]|uniref:hypothetical protein n=1 Tax=Ornithinimicrobium sp. TaxID=1977084 RepID=UPI002B46B727|nr:hypothetical protein [Ornithinimicrobium sp.]HKJ11449.1 hypothetical protein [Ornithinimicrobium sp.]
MGKRASGQRRLLVASLLLVFGGWLPWLYTGVGTVSGARGAGLWVFYAGLLALAGALLPPRFSTASLVQALVVAAAGMALPAWQVARMLALVGMQGWLPGPGLVMSFFGGVLCALAARDLMEGRSAQRAGPP